MSSAESSLIVALSPWIYHPSYAIWIHMGPIGSLAANPSRQIDRFPSCRTRVSATRREGRLMWFPMFPFAALLSDIVLLSGDMMQSYITLYYIILYILYVYLHTHIYIYINIHTYSLMPNDN